MTWSYTASATPSTKDQVRLLVGDVDVADQLLQDEEVNAFLAGGAQAQGNVWLAASMACLAIAGKFRRRVTSAAGHVKVDLSQQAQAYMDHANWLTMQAQLNVPPLVYLGGMSIADKQTAETNTDRVQPFFSRVLGKDQGGAPGTLAPDPTEPVAWWP